MEEKIETLNKFMVTAGGKGIVMLNGPHRGMTFTADDALLLAAYLVSMAEHDAAHTFEEVLNAVQNA